MKRRAISWKAGSPLADMYPDLYPPTWDRETIEWWEAAHPNTVETWFPPGYAGFVGSAAGRAVDQAISDLVENEDLVERTVRYLIVGYLVTQLTKARVIRRKAAEKPDPATWNREAIEKWEAAHPNIGEPFEPIYIEFLGSAAWQATDQAISDLVENQDLVEGTIRYYIVGYLVKELTRARVIRRKAAKRH